MANPEFWRNLASELRSLPFSGSELRADWQYTTQVQDNPPQTSVQWNLVGGSHIVRLDFEALARRAGTEIADPYDPRDLLVIWLEYLKQELPDIGSRGDGNTGNPDGTVSELNNFGTIPHICDASANLCKVLESRALEAERIAKAQEQQRITSKKSIPLRLAKYEALVYGDQTRYRCPHCKYDHYDAAEVGQHVLHTHTLALPAVVQVQVAGENMGLLPKGDAALLGSKRAVNFKIAEQYLGISERQRQS